MAPWYSSGRSETFPRSRQWLTGVVGLLCIVAGPVAADSHWNDLAEDLLCRIRRATEQLREPLTPTERFPFLAPVAHLWGGEQPHRQAIRKLVATGIPAASFALIEVAADPDFPYRPEAIEALGAVPHPVSVDWLLLFLSDSSAEVQIAAIGSLGEFAREGVAEDRLGDIEAHLRALLEEAPDPAVRGAAAAVLPALGMSGVGAVVGRARRPDDSPALVCRQIRLLAFFSKHQRPAQRRRVQRQLLADVRAPTPSFAARAQAHLEMLPSEIWQPCTDPRSEAIRAIGVIGVGGAEKLLASIVAKDPDSEMRAAAMTAFQTLGGGLDQGVIRVGLEDPNVEVRSHAVVAAFASDEVRSTELSDYLARMLAEDDSAVLRSRIAATSVDLPGTWPALVRALADDSIATRRAVGVALLARARPAEMRLLLQALGGEPRTAIRAARILAVWPEDEVGDELVAVLEAGPPEARERAALALGLRGQERTRHALEIAAAGANSEVALASIQALQDLDRTASLPALEALASGADDERVRRAALRAHGLIARAFLPMEEGGGEGSRVGDRNDRGE